MKADRSLKRLFAKIYETMLTEKLGDFDMMSRSYDAEQKQLEEEDQQELKYRNSRSRILKSSSRKLIGMFIFEELTLLLSVNWCRLSGCPG